MILCKGIKNEFNGRLGEFNPRYAAANKVREVGFNIIDAVEEGGKFRSVKTGDLEFERAFKKLKTDVERMAFRSGMLQDLRILGRKENQSLPNKILGDKLIEGRLKTTFPDDESFDTFSFQNSFINGYHIKSDRDSPPFFSFKFTFILSNSMIIDNQPNHSFIYTLIFSCNGF